MIISKPEIKLTNGEVIVSAKVEFQKPLLKKPETVWFSFPESYLPYISGRADAFAVGLLPLAMAVGEELVIEGQLSPRLAWGLQEYQLALNFWYPKKLNLVNICASGMTSLPVEQAGHVCVTLFSGGVDSTYTLVSHLPERQPHPDFQVSHAIFVHGFDIPLQNRSEYEEVSNVFSRELLPWGVEVIPCRTNLHYFSSGLLDWGIAHGAAIIAIGLTLDKLIRYFLVPASYSLYALNPWGSSPVIDHWLSTETLQVIHHGTPFLRIEKVAAFADWPPAQQFLRVCIDANKRSGVNNCSRCDKCLRTMVALEVCDSLKPFKTFKQPFGRLDVLRWVPHYDSNWFSLTAQYARRFGKQDYIFPMRVANLSGKIRRWLLKAIPSWIFKRLKEKAFPYERDIFNPIFLDENP